MVASPPVEQSQRKIFGGIEVIPFTGEGIVSERPLLLSVDGGRKLEQRNYAYWASAPPQMLRDQLIAYLRQAGVADRVVPSEPRIDSAYEVRGTIKRLEPLVRSDTGAVVSRELTVMENAGDRLVMSRVYTAERSTSGHGIDEAVAALNESLDEIFAAFAGDLSAAGLQAAARQT